MDLYIDEDNSIGGHYWYSKFGNLIDLKGAKVSPNKIIVKEETGEQFELILNDDGNISGTWNNQGKSFPIVFE